MEISRPSSGYGYLTPTYDDPPSTGGPSSTEAGAQYLPTAVAGGVAAHVRNKREETDGTFPDNRPGTPDASSDAYAAYVTNIGTQSPLSDTQLTSLRQGVLRSIDYSQGRLADAHTADLIRDTLLGALGGSPTFRAAVSYGLNNHHSNLGDITYCNEYEPNYYPNGSDTPLPIGQLTLGIVQHNDPQAPAAFPHGQAIRGPLGYPYISVGAAPNSDSPYMPSWRQGLIHEIIHQVTSSNDPQESEIDRQGPTELIARRVADEMGWYFPTFRGYADPDRTAYLRARNQAALIDTVQRHPGREHEVFRRLDTIGSGRYASGDFSEIGDNRSNDTAAWQPGADHPAGPAPLVLHPAVFGLFANSAPAGVPAGFTSATEASGASWATQGRFFQCGKPVDGNPHARAFTFADGSKVVIRAHEPTLVDSDGMKFGRFMTVASSALVGGVSGFMAGGPVGATAGATAAAIPAFEAASSYDYDRIWQGYTLDYYGKNATKPFQTQYMYAWDSDAQRVEKMSSIKDPNQWVDYANFNPDKNWNWWTWKADGALLER